jgi:hypothetical protein
MQTHDGQARQDEVSASNTRSRQGCNAPSRRTFLIGGAAAGLVAATATQSRAQVAALKREEGESPLPTGAIGYWDGQSGTVMPAARLKWGDRSLIENGVRVTVHGLGSEHPDPNIAGFALLAHFPTQLEGIAVKFHAWKYRSDTLNHRSSPVGFSMPVSRTEGLALSVVYPRKSDSALGVGMVRTEHVCRFSPTGWNKQPKLRQGVYFVALPDGSSTSLPNWEECRFVPEYDAGVLVGGTMCRLTATGIAPVGFHYLILSIDPETASQTAAV